MGLNLKQIFSVILYVTAIFLPVETDCPEHKYTIGSREFIWPQTPNSDFWIASNCLDESKRLIFRQCLNDRLTPNNTQFEILCLYENAELPSNDCPHHFTSFQIQGSSPKTICALETGIQYNFVFDRSVCIQDSILALDLNTEEQNHFIIEAAQRITSLHGIFTLSARKRYPSKDISKDVNYDEEDVELHDVRCGHFGMLLKFNNTVPVYCTEDLCENMCLSLNATTEPFSQVIEQCNEYVIAKFKNTFLHPNGCPSGYYRTEYDYVHSGNYDACFSIQMFPEPMSVKDLEDANVVDSFCNGNIMPIFWGDDVFVFRQLSEQIGLTQSDHCLFGLTSKKIIEYSDWDDINVSQINLFNLNWDKTMNYSRIINEEEVSYLASKGNGQWTWVNGLDKVSCIACMVDSPIPHPALHLKYNSLERKLELEVTHQDFLYRDKSFDPGFICFLVFRGVYKTNLTISTVPNSDSKYIVEDAGLGQYWCTGHSAIKRRYVSSQQIFAYGIWFAFEVERKCSTECSFTSDDSLRFIEFFKELYDFVSIRDYTFVASEADDFDSGYTFTAHLSLTLYDKVDDKLLTDLVNITEYQLETFTIYERLKNMLIYAENFVASNEMKIKSIKSTEYCLHESTSSIDTIIWGIAHSGETISISPLCSSHKYDTRTCSGDYIHGYFWDEPISVVCKTFVSEHLLRLYYSINEHEDPTLLDNLKRLLQKNIKFLMPVDVFLTSRILQNVSDVTLMDIEKIFTIYNSLMQVDETVLKASSSSNILLKTLENILLNYIENSVFNTKEFYHFGKSSLHSQFIETYIFDPNVSGFSGVALYRPRKADILVDDFRSYSRGYINANETTDEIITRSIDDMDLVIGSHLPTDVLNSLNNITIVMTVFFNDQLFQSIDESSEKIYPKANGKIISIKILGLDDDNEPPNRIPIFFESVQNDDPKCGYWNDESINGWSSNGCQLKDIFVNDYQQIALCECYHFSHVGYLGDIPQFVEVHDNTQIIIFVVTSLFSLVPALGILVTAMAFSKWRQKLSSKILINFASAIALQMILTICINANDQLISTIASNKSKCVAIGSVYHYSVLATFLWMLIITYFQAKEYISVANISISHLLIKSIIFGWGAPIIPVIITLIIDHLVPIYEQPQFCYSIGWAMYFGAVVPVVLISFINFIAFISALFTLRKKISDSSCATEATELSMALSQLRWYLFLFSMLGLTWLFGFLSRLIPNSYLTFSYLYSITACIQGLVIFLCFIVFDPNVRSLWVKYFSKVREIYK